MNEIRLKAFAKLNLTFDVVGKLSNGYHDILSVMQTISLHDDLIISMRSDSMVKLRTNVPWLPINANNLVYKVASDLISQYGLCGVNIKLFKRIPSGAGLGGGSSDCAATLIGMREMFSLPISDEQAAEILEQYGADVPFFLTQGTCLVSGIGNVIKKLPPHPYAAIVLVKPKFSCSTRKIYSKLDLNCVREPNITDMLKAITFGNLKFIARNFYNALETVVVPIHPIIENIKQNMIDNGALGSSMTGSGSVVFGYFRKRNIAMNAAEALRKNFEGMNVIVTSTYTPEHI